MPGSGHGVTDQGDGDDHALHQAPDPVGLEPVVGARTVVPPTVIEFHMAHWALPCMSGPITSITTRPVSSVGTRSTIPSGLSTGPVPHPEPPMAAKKMSSWRHITPFGIPTRNNGVENKERRPFASHHWSLHRQAQHPALGTIGRERPWIAP